MTRTFEDALLDAVQRVKKAGTEYAISGGVAKALYGAPAFTKDLDVLAREGPPLERALRPQFTLVASGPGPDAAYEDVTGFVVEVFEARTEVEREMLARAQDRALGPERVKVLEPTDWAAMKLREARLSPLEAERHLGDVRRVHALEPLDCVRLAALSKRLDAERQFKALGTCEGPGE